MLFYVSPYVSYFISLAKQDELNKKLRLNGIMSACSPTKELGVSRATLSRYLAENSEVLRW
jgi:hypothetical protein